MGWSPVSIDCSLNPLVYCRCKQRPAGVSPEFINVFSVLLNESAVCAPNQSYINGERPGALDGRSTPTTVPAPMEPQLWLIVAVVTLVVCFAVGVTCLFVCRSRSSPADRHGEYAVASAAQPADGSGNHKNEKGVSNCEKADAQEV